MMPSIWFLLIFSSAEDRLLADLSTLRVLLSLIWLANVLAKELFDWLIKATLNETFPLLPLLKLPKTNRNIRGNRMPKNRAKRSRKKRRVLSLVKTKTVKSCFFRLIALIPECLSGHIDKYILQISLLN